MNDNGLERLVETAMKKIHELADCETVVGKPIIADGTTIIPISKVSVGFTSGGSDLPTKGSKEMFGGGTAGGVSLQPLAFITITNPVNSDIQIHKNSIMTTKQDKINHGFGIYSIKKAIEKYNGNLDLLCDNNIFSLHITLELQNN